jgi:rhodanese-related sulfurtransferase
MAGYAGDLTPKQAWELLETEPGAVLVDVRTQPEWSYVGVPDLSGLGKPVVTLSWQVFPSMSVNQGFASDLAAAGVKPDQPVLFLCRSGARSAAAAAHMTAKGYERCYNISDGFEGPHDSHRHRGTVAGWQHDGLPWVQG